MACKHEGGMEPCIRNKGRNCIANDRQYHKENIRKSGAPRSACSDRGAAAEHLVISECLCLGLPTGGPYNQNGPHDLFVRVSSGWKTVQVKMGRINTKTGFIQAKNRRAGIISDLIAVVDLEGKRCRWISNTDEQVPWEFDQVPEELEAPALEEVCA